MISTFYRWAYDALTVQYQSNRFPVSGDEAILSFVSRLPAGKAPSANHGAVPHEEGHPAGYCRRTLFCFPTCCGLFAEKRHYTISNLDCSRKSKRLNRLLRLIAQEKTSLKQVESFWFMVLFALPLSSLRRTSPPK